MSKSIVLKFGGTSLQNAAFIKRAANIVHERTGEGRPFVVVSAVACVTARLIELADLSVHETAKAKQMLGLLTNQHLELLAGVGDASPRNQEELTALFNEARNIYFDSAYRSKHPGAWKDRLLSTGERASCLIFAAALNTKRLPAKAVDAQHLIKTDDVFGAANVLTDTTRELIQKSLRSFSETAVITGFIGSTLSGETTTLGRSGSDYTAGLIADALKAARLEIWTDVNGILTADPAIVPTAQPIETLSFEDVMELSAHGAKVIHPKTIDPIKDTDICVAVRNTYQPEQPGTSIRRGYTSNGSFRSVTVTGPFAYVEVPDRHARLLERLIEEQLGSDPDSEGYSYTRASRFEPAQFIVKESLFARIRESIQSWNRRENIRLHIQSDLFRVKKFINGFSANDQPAALTLQRLSKEGIRPVCYSRTHNRRYLSLLFTKEDAFKAARLINDCLVNTRPVIDLFVAGTGTVGSMLLKQIDEYSSQGICLRTIGLCNSRSMCFNEKGSVLDDLRDKRNSRDTDWSSIIQQLTTRQKQPLIFIDSTGSEEVARYYPQLLETGIHIVTPSKLANTAEQSFYDLLRTKARENNAHFRYETTVGAGLPIISTIQNLQKSGDTITELTGVLSGTMTYLFNELEKGTPFSRAVFQARKLGYAEPDPRDDLSGEDVARKFLTLARETGTNIERQQLEVQSLIPEELVSVDRNTFLNRLPEFDDYWKYKIERAHQSGDTLRYLGSFRNGKIQIGVEAIPSRSALGRLSGTDNLLHISSHRYRHTPIVIQGPGAGSEVTAAGVLSDVLEIANLLK